jgi:hypothetical protein
MRRQSMVSRQDDDKRPNSPTVDESISCGRVFYSSMVRSWLRFQPIDATHWLNRSAGVSKSSVSLGRSLSRRATAFSRF